MVAAPLTSSEREQLRKLVDQARRRKLVRAGAFKQNGRLTSRATEHRSLERCDHCGQPIVDAKRSTKIYCDPHCRRAANRLRS